MQYSKSTNEEIPASGIRRQLHIVIFGTETKLGRLFDLVLLWAIFISIIAVVLESDKTIESDYRSVFDIIEWALTLFFTLEYCLRIFVTNKPSKYVFSFYGVIDFLAVIPAYISFIFPSSQYLIVLRVLRLLRVFRILKLARYINAAGTLGQALMASRYKIAIFFGVIISLVLIMGTCMYIVEGQQEGFASIPKSMYWTIVTMTTVGYGDVVPVTTLGKMVASIMMLVGYAIIAVPTGIVTSELTSQHKKLCDKCKNEIED